MKNIHFTNIVIQKPYAVVWNWLSDPMKYPKLYPGWAARTEKVGKDKYEITNKQNRKSIVVRKMNRGKGAIDLIIGDELSQTRIFPLKSDTIVVHIGSRWKQMRNPISWLLYKSTVNSDFKNAKKIMERS